MLLKLCVTMLDKVMQMSIRTYSELITIPDYLDRFEYLKLGGAVGKDTFGHDRYLNQILYNSYEWRRFRRDVIMRDNGCDLGHPDFEIVGTIYIHHIDPLTIEDVLARHPKIFDMDNVICCSLDTHNAIHYGDKDLLTTGPIVRLPNDTCPWKV